MFRTVLQDFSPFESLKTVTGRSHLSCDVYCLWTWRRGGFSRGLLRLKETLGGSVIKDLQFWPPDLCVSSGVTVEETAYACPSESRAGGLGDAVSLWATGSPHQGTDAAGRCTTWISGCRFSSFREPPWPYVLCIKYDSEYISWGGFFFRFPNIQI